MSSYQGQSLLIPARPELLLALSDMVRLSDPGIDKVANLIKTDVSLYANTLALINSAFTGLRRRVSCINTAVRILGVRRTLSIVRMAALRSTLDSTGRMDQFWDDANLTAAICTQLAKKFQFIAPDDAYTLGMMCNCAVPLLYKQFPNYRHFYEEDSLLDLSEQYQHEQNEFGVNRFEISSKIAGVWTVPSQLCDIIAQQPFYQTVLSMEQGDEQQRNTLALLLMAKELGLKFGTLWGTAAEYQPTLELELVQEQLCLTAIDMKTIEQQVFDSLELHDYGVMTK